tara:strand:+ start:154 stop:942 length:789 start_codon:yes stop_codon:yes gene_type:complete
VIGFNKLGNNGHVGNQMFQYASLMGIASHNNYEWAIAPHECFGKDYTELRSSIYDCFKIPSAKNQLLIDGPEVLEPTPYFNEEFFNNCPDNVTIQGYLQDEKYFKHIKKDILKEFTFIDSIQTEAESFIKQYDRQKVSVHVRRTDYIDGPASTNRSVTPLDYYKRALSLFKESTFFIFSDDVEWCRKAFQGDNAVFPNRNAYVDLCIMSLCDHNIITNSSYSWWASYINKNPNKQVIAPPSSSWLDYRDASHMYLDNWTIID